MKHADAMLKKILEEVDTNRDGEIEFEGILKPHVVFREQHSPSIC